MEERVFPFYKLWFLWKGSSAALFGRDIMRATCVISNFLVKKKNQKQMQLILKIYFVYPQIIISTRDKYEND